MSGLKVCVNRRRLLLQKRDENSRVIRIWKHELLWYFSCVFYRLCTQSHSFRIFLIRSWKKNFSFCHASLWLSTFTIFIAVILATLAWQTLLRYCIYQVIILNVNSVHFNAVKLRNNTFYGGSKQYWVLQNMYVVIEHFIHCQENSTVLTIEMVINLPIFSLKIERLKKNCFVSILKNQVLYIACICMWARVCANKNIMQCGLCMCASSYSWLFNNST